MSSTKNLTDEEIEEAYGNINHCFDEGTSMLQIITEFDYTERFIKKY
jgi:hypothetical protein